MTKKRRHYWYPVTPPDPPSGDGLDFSVTSNSQYLALFSVGGM